jgi:hypothetical protein
MSHYSKKIIDPHYKYNKERMLKQSRIRKEMHKKAHFEFVSDNHPLYRSRNRDEIVNKL